MNTDSTDVKRQEGRALFTGGDGDVIGSISTHREHGGINNSLEKT